MKIDRNKVLQEYMKEVDNLFEEDEFMVHMTAEQCVNTVCKVIERLYETNSN